MKKALALWIAQGFGVGRSPVAPGTFGTVVGIPFYLLMQDLSWLWYTAVVVVMFAIGVWAAQSTVEQYGEEDHQSIVWDEVVGFLITMIAAPAHWMWIPIGFVVFRFYDIIKPWPISWLDNHAKGGFGAMADDAMAGVFGALTIWLLAQFF